MTFPEQADIEFFIKHRSIFWPIWEQEPGDFFEDGLGRVRTVPSDWDGPTWKRLGRYNFLPRQGQLQEMLEERGYSSQLVVKPDICLVNIWGEDLAGRFDEGPTPSIALGKCLLEVLKEE